MSVGIENAGATPGTLTGLSGRDLHVGRVFAAMFIGEGGQMQFAQVYFTALSADPDNPAANMSCAWQSDGTGSGGDGDIMVKITDSGGTTKTATLIDFSAV